MSVRFTQSCPTCGRRIQIAASLLGCTVACQHCKGEFVANAGSEADLPDCSELNGHEASDPLMDRVEQALERARSQTAMS
jgi:hypothetical protein